MNSRDRKGQIYARYRQRGKFWLTAEDRAWLNMVPIGREFGSKDYERLEILDAFTHGRINSKDAMRLLGIDSDALAAMVEKDGLPTQFVDDLLQSIGEVDARKLVPYEFSTDDASPDSPESCSQPADLKRVD